MKNFIFLFLFLIPAFIRAQDKLVFSQSVIQEIMITRMNYDTLFYNLNGNNDYMLHRQFQTIYSPDKFKKFLYKNPSVFDSKNIDLQFTNYCLDKFRIQTNIGRALEFTGAGIVMASVIYGWKSNPFNLNTDALYTTMITGYSISLIGLIIDLNANHWLKNIQVTGVYHPGLGYVFRF